MTKPTKRIFVVHRWGGSSGNDWLPWAADELRQLGHEVVCPDFPNTDNPTIGEWVPHLAQLVGTPNVDTFFIGHSVGCQTILRYLETINTSVGGAIFVSGWFNLENLEDSEAEKIAEPWLTTPINLEKIREVLPKSTLIISDNDPYGALEENKRKFASLGSKIVVLHDAGHITADDGYTELPILIKELEGP